MSWANPARGTALYSRPSLTEPPEVRSLGPCVDAPKFAHNLRRALAPLPVSQRIDLGCSLLHGAFELGRPLRSFRR
jgi:hypothetical protein